jgi:signal transduction histidine kinase
LSGRFGISIGLLGRVFAILLLAVGIEFGASTYLYERSSHYSVREDEARRLAEHLVIARKLLDERAPADRPALAEELTTDRYDVSWSPDTPTREKFAPALDQTGRQILTWEPSLQATDMRLRLTSPGRNAAVLGELRLSDGSWLLFRTHGLVESWDLAASRIALALVPATALLILGGLLIRRALSPIRLLARATERVGSGERIAVPEGGTGEVRQLVRAFNAMQHRIHDLIEDRTQALAAVGHDLRTPLARVQLRAEAIRDEPVRDAIARDVAEMDDMVASLLAFLGGEDDPEHPVRTDVAVMAATTIDQAQDLGADALYEGPDHLEADVRPIGLRRTLVNLVDNALHYGTAVRLSVAREAGAIRIRVEDNGPGIPEDQMEKVLRPFARLDTARRRNTKGLGLGLAIAARAVGREAGTLTLSNLPDRGLRVEIVLPHRT